MIPMHTRPSHLALASVLLLASAAPGCGSTGAVTDPEPSGAPDDAYRDVAKIRIELEVSGGIAGVGYSFVVDGASGEVRGLRCLAHCPFEAGETIVVVSAAQVGSLARMLVDAGLLTLDRGDFGTQCCDQFHYVLTYADGTAAQTVRGSSEALPGDLRAVVATLHGLAYGIRPVLLDLLGSLDDWPRDRALLRAVSMDGSHLTLEVEYAGGCGEHLFDLVAWNGWLESYPVQVGIVLVHDDRGDRCEALVREELVFDLGPLRRAYVDAYRETSATVVLRLVEPGSDDPSQVRFIEYSF